jgi:hypothetical protein
MIVKVEGVHLPGRQCDGYADVAVGVQRRGDVVEIQPADATAVSWTFEIATLPAADGGLDVRGPFVHGRPGNRFIYLSWGEQGAGGRFTMFRRAKLMFDAVPPETLAAAAVPGCSLVARLGLTDACGMPLCAAVRPPAVTWSAVPATRS